MCNLCELGSAERDQLPTEPQPQARRRPDAQGCFDFFPLSLPQPPDRLEDEMFEWAATHPATPALLMLQLNMFRDWVDFRREAFVDTVIANMRALLSAHGGMAPREKEGRQ